MSNIDELVSKSASSVASTLMEKGSFVFVVPNYSILCKGFGVGKSIRSEKFIVGGHTWEIIFCPDGRNDDTHNAGYASLYISHVDKTTTVQCVLELCVLDQSGKGNHREMVKLEFTLNGSLMVGDACFIKREILESPDFLKDDCLKIRTTVQVLTSDTQNITPIEIPESNIGMELGKILETKHGADIFFKVDGESFYAHKCILAARSPGFESRFSDAHQEISVPNIEPRIFKALLWFIYTGTILEEEQEAPFDGPFMFINSFTGKMLAAAERFELKTLKNLCESRLMERLSVDTIAYLLHLADLHHATELKAACLRFAASNQADVMASDGSKYLRESCPSLYLELAGYKENPVVHLTRGKDLDVCSKILCVVKESFRGILLPSNATDTQQKVKEV